MTNEWIQCGKLNQHLIDAFHQTLTMHHCFLSHNRAPCFFRKHLSNYPAHDRFWKWLINIITAFVPHRHRRLPVNGARMTCDSVCVCVQLPAIQMTFQGYIYWDFNTRMIKIKGNFQICIICSQTQVLIFFQVSVCKIRSLGKAVFFCLIRRDPSLKGHKLISFRLKKQLLSGDTFNERHAQ